ncbi:hypothetical protein OG393_22775 [Streptomyces sp. NBC_01216]|uniref:DUF6883 domain-containing protein n=1 Tax=Streptomyces sp. NBC_01216 TaxID=2903778 RepID=UPI002E0DC1BC|nr:DUF6883 domain-containing protein [Streptomyces sp. NBC_01216]WSQ67258.1 hypothetical protein OG393_22775 [Streptomyces sp. NBC_01216]
MTEASAAAISHQAPIAIFVSADDFVVSREFEYGPQIKRAILSAILTVDEPRRCQFQTYWGSLLLPSFRWESSSSDGKLALARDPLLLWSAASTLCRGSEGRWSTLGAHAPWLLGTSNVYVGVISRLPSELRAPLDDQLRAFSWYLGAIEVGPNDPLHQEVFSPLPEWRYSRGRVDHPGGEGISAEELFAGLAVDGIGLGERPIAEHHCQIPWTPATLPSEAPVTLGALASSGGRTYQESIAALVHEYQEAERRLSFTVGRQQPLVDDLRSKLHDYALNLAHPDGGSKARFFQQELGIEQSNWRLLAIQLISALHGAEPKKFRDNRAYGDTQQLRFEISAPVVGLNGQTKQVTAAWKIEDDAPVQLVTLYPGRKIPGAVDSPAIVPGDWAGLYEIALKVADRARQECRPTPMALEGPGGVEVIAAGLAGFAWVCFPDARTAFVQWLLRAGHASKSQPGARISAPGQDLEPAAAWAEAMASVFQAADQSCSVEQEVD